MEIESMEIDDLTQTFEEWIGFIHTLPLMSEEFWNSSLVEGKWTIRDIVCHIMCWDKYFYEEAIHKITTDKQITLKHLNFDEFNSNSIKFGRTITIDELIEKTIYYREHIIEDIRSLSEVNIQENYTDADGNIFNILQYLKDFIWHDQHHMNPIKEFQKELAI